MSARCRSKLAGMTRSALEQVIYESCLGEINEYIVRRYLIDKIPHIEIAGEIEERYGVRMDRSSVSKRWEACKRKMESI